MLYRCRKCRRLLATQSNVVPVTEGPGSIAFKYRFVSMVHVTTTNGHAQIHEMLKIPRAATKMPTCTSCMIQVSMAA